MLEIFMKNIQNKDTIELWNSVLEFLPEILKEENGLSYVASFITYSLTKSEESDRVAVEALLNNKTLRESR